MSSTSPTDESSAGAETASVSGEELEASYEAYVTPKSLKIWLILASTIGLFAAAMLVFEKITFWMNKAEGKSTALSCDVSPLVGCGGVINEPQASIFGSIPNPLIGVMAWAALLAVAVLLASGLKLRSWHWAALQAGVLFGLAMVTYLQFASIYQLGVLCPYCMVTWAVTIPTFWVITARNLRARFPETKASVVYNWTPLWIFFHFVVLLGLIFERFGTAIFA